MRIGVLKKFGLKKRDGTGVPFGFLAEADESAAEIYFNEKGIAPASHFQENYHRDSLVVYEVRSFRDGRREAFQVRLLEELDRKEQLLLYRECRDEKRDAELELLHNYWKRPKRVNQRVQTGVVTKFGLTDDYGSLFGFLRNSNGEKEFRFERSSLSPGVYNLYRQKQNTQSFWSRNRSRYRKSLLENCFVVYQEHRVNDKWSIIRVQLPEELSENTLFSLYQEWRDGNQGSELEWLFGFKPIPLEQESDEDLIVLILMMKAGNNRVSKVLEQRPELLWTSPEVCSCISSCDITATSLALITTGEQVAFLAQYVTDTTAWFAIVRNLPDSLVLSCPRAMSAVDSKRAISLLSYVDSTSEYEGEQACFDLLMTRINWRDLSEADINVIRPMLEPKSDAYIVSLILQAQAENRPIAGLIKLRPKLLWTSPEVCACVRWEDIGDLPLDQLIPADESECRHALLAKFDFRYHTRRYLDTVQPLLEHEPDEYIISLITQLKAEGQTIAPLLKWKPELLWTSPEVCACTEGSDIEASPSLTPFLQTDEQAAFLAEHAGDDAWSHIAGQLPGTVLLHCQRALNTITEYRVRSLLFEIDWTAASEEDLTRGCALLKRVNWCQPNASQMNTIRPLLERESDADLASLVTQARAAEWGVSALLAWKPELLWTNSEVCACVRWYDIENLPLEQLIQTDEQTAFLAEHTSEDVWSHIAPKLSGTLLLHCGKAMACITKNQINALLAGADWTDTSEKNLEDYRPLLAMLHWNTLPDQVVAAAASLYEQGMALNLCWWQRLTDSMKIRLLMYLSNFAQDEPAERKWFEDLQKIWQWEDEEKNRLVCTVLQFFAGIYTEAGIPYRNNFLQAHRMLMEYITDSFTQGTDVTPGLSSLLEHCRSTFCPRYYFCDGRSWRNQNRVYCPRIGRPCPHYEDMDLTKTKFRTARQRGGAMDYRELSFMDFLLNVGGIPDLSRGDVGINVKEEYPFRISAYVNGLVRLRPHMKCSYCGELFHPKFQYAKLITARLPVTVFHCSKSAQEGEHDQDIYLNFCYRCHEIIDSRECCTREKLSAAGDFEGVISTQENLFGSESRYGQYLCMHCGGSMHIVLQNALYCPQCACGDPELVHRTPKGGIVCDKCGYHSSEFRSKFEENLFQNQ